MSSNNVSEDLRSIKTRKALSDAMFSLLKSSNFKKITIKRICEEALISRAAFYAHYIDKYDLLKHWLTMLLPSDLSFNGNYEQMEKMLNCYAYENMLIIENLLYDADDETLGILFDHILATMRSPAQKSGRGAITSVRVHSEELSPKDIVLSNFYVGGIIYYLSWQIKNKFPPEVPPMNRHLYDIVSDFYDRQLN